MSSTHHDQPEGEPAVQGTIFHSDLSQSIHEDAIVHGKGAEAIDDDSDDEATGDHRGSGVGSSPRGKVGSHTKGQSVTDANVTYAADKFDSETEEKLASHHAHHKEKGDSLHDGTNVSNESAADTGVTKTPTVTSCCADEKKQSLGAHATENEKQSS